MKDEKIIHIGDFKLILATREIARHIFRVILKKSVTYISFDNANFASRSFLDEIYLLSAKNKIKIIDMPKELKPLYDIVVKSHKDNKVYAPKIKVLKLEKTFA